MSANLRSDARRNREKILAAASELFAERGADMCMDDLARRAGVGHATVFRRFPSKDALVTAMLEERLAAVAAEIEEAAGREDPWEGLVAAMTAVAERQAKDRGLKEAVGNDCFGAESLASARARIVAGMDALLRRAQSAGRVREDLGTLDVFFLISAASMSTPPMSGLPGLWRRYLGVVLDGMRPEGASPLSPPAPTVEEFEAAVARPAAASSA